MKNVVKLLVLAIPLSGCATKEYVHEYVQGQLKPVNSRLNNLDGRVASTDAALKTGLEAANKRVDESFVTLQVHTDRLNKHDTDIAQVSKTAQEAVERAAAAGKLAEGKMVYEVVLSEDKVKFAPGKSALNKDAKAALDEFVAKIKEENRGVFIEVQGHTDSIGSAASNKRIGQARADAVLQYLHDKGLPMHRLSAVSYGEAQPVESNQNRGGRSKNRRVVLVVLN